MAYGGIANTGILFGVARARTDDQLSGVLRDELVKSDFVIAKDSHGGAFESKILVDVPREGIVVVDQDDIAGGGNGRRGLRMVGRVINDWQRCGHGGRSLSSVSRLELEEPYV